MPTLPEDDYNCLEKKLYLPMLMKVLERDLLNINMMPFKLHRPYIKILENTLAIIRNELKVIDIHLIRKDMRVVKWGSNGESTTYAFISSGVEDHREFLNANIKMKCEELLSTYLAK